VYLLRHAKSDWSDPTAGDHDRPLARRGRRDAQRLADHFRRDAIAPELVLCSSAVRAQQTLAPIAAAAGIAADRIRVEEGLYGAAAVEILARLRRIDAATRSVLVVGHNPGLQDLAIELAGDDRALLGAVREKFPTGALAVVSFAGAAWTELSPLTASVTSLTVPRALP
jgi:phosphohistidine phosphatase